MKRLLQAALLSFAASSCVVAKNAYAPSVTGAARQQASATAHFLSERRWGDRHDYRWEPFVAADPASNWVYQITTDQRPNYLLFRASSDGGRTWLEARHLCRRGKLKVPWQFDPQIAVAGDGTVYAVCLDGFRPGVVFTRSRDHGRTWAVDVRLDTPLRYSDKPTLVASGDDIYVAFNSYNAIYVASSHDRGATWEPPVRATTEHRWYYSYSGTVAPDGSVWFAVDGETGRDETGDGHIELVMSADRGATWRTIPFAFTHEGAPCTRQRCYPDFYTGEDAVAVDRTGSFIFVFAKNETKQGPNALYESHSRDGVRWSAASAINTLGNTTSPAIEAGPAAGDFRLVWQDNRNGPNAWNTWYARTTDGGITWSSPIRLSDRTSGEPYKDGRGYDLPFGDYLGLAVDPHGVDHVIWGEGADIYYPGTTWWTRD